MSQKINGLCLYRGPSMLDGAPIIVIATGFEKASTNGKTGALVQTWILRDDVNPIAAVNSGADASICGDCPHRGIVVDGKNVGRSCYVTLFQAPRNIWATFHRGRYPMVAPADLAKTFEGLPVRLGAYGDPAAVPFWIWDSVMSRASFGTGYTHSWRRFPELAAYCMASCDSLADRLAAKILGFRTFRVRANSEPRLPEEAPCPASAEMGKRTDCANCKLCGGTKVRAKDIVINAHGSADKVNNFKRLIAA